MSDKTKKTDGDDEMLARIERYLKKHDAKADGLETEVLNAFNALLGQAKDFRGSYKENQEQITELTKEVEALKKQLEPYIELGEDPAKLKEELETGRAAATALEQRKVEDERSRIATLMNWKPDVLNQLMKLTPDLEFDVQDVEVEGPKGEKSTEKRVYITGADKVKVSASEFLEKNEEWAPFQSALVVNDEQPAERRALPSQNSTQNQPLKKEVSEDAIRKDQSTRLRANVQF